MQLVDAAVGYHVEEVLCVVPRVFPHKEYYGATLEQRLEMLALAEEGGLPYSVATSEAGLFLDIARECRALWTPACNCISSAGGMRPSGFSSGIMAGRASSRRCCASLSCW